MRAVQQRKREKEQEALDRARMEEILRRDKEERFGKKYVEKQQAVQQQQKQQSPLDKFIIRLKQIVTASPPDLMEGKAKTCLSTIKIYICKLFNDFIILIIILIRKRDKRTK